MIINMRCLYINKKQPKISVDILMDIFGLDVEIDEEFLFPDKAFPLIISAGWQVQNLIKETDKYIYTFIK